MVSVSAECRPVYRPRYLLIVGQNVDLDSADISVDTLLDMSTDIFLSLYRPRVSLYVERYISRVSVDMSTNTAVECRSICRPIYRLRGAQNTHDPANVWSPDISMKDPRIKRELSLGIHDVINDQGFTMH